ncbi:MAG: biotin synthase BioB [Candidatus Omnitrophica bacterium]|nr:biotin synthase BioB [Candidatus Omnitrophota bacterium]MBU1127926.1 biotin synthase BioB [Candidatus Omnitrophota bacterium]MBU1657093.1 biotin synthase BioB [Candidatus Omnitrophota bacterium]MBU1784301.1 biotin synthase BioB [Candidatus Omnitrophota bacterium]MBU1851609.1 biotin synthase BioB [Candidatus Omnitrophota bacterium]
MDRAGIEKLLSAPLEELIIEASRVRREKAGSGIELCGIVAAKSGACPEDCKFCAQSARHCTHIPEYPLKSAEEIALAAREAKGNGASRFGIVTSGNKLTRPELDVICGAIRKINNDAGITVCASLGALDETDFHALKDSGLTRYHHNIETSRRFYPEIVSTHEYAERINTIKAAKGAGLQVCSGGIIGLGETWLDRIAMAFLLKELDVDAVPLNVLIPVRGTPMEGTGMMAPFDVIRTIALFRIVMEGKDVKVAAGREIVLKDFGALMYMAGANGMMVGGYLTVAGRTIAEDLALAEEVRRLWKNG